MLYKIHGLIAAPFTALQPDGSLCLERVAAQAGVLKSQGVQGVFVGGTTGEGESLTVSERMNLADAWISQAEDDFKIIVHVGHASARQGAALATHAAEIGADAIGAIYLHHHLPTAVEDLASFCGEIAQGAPSLPFYYYHMPAQTGLKFKASEILQAGTRIIPNLVGCKFTHEDLMDFQQCLDLEDGRFDVLFGRDEMLLASLALGAEGWIGSTFNFAGSIHQKLIKAFRAGDLKEARRCQRDVNEIIRIVAKRSWLPSAKAAFGIYGVDLGTVRLPVQPLSEPEVVLLHQQLRSFPIGRATEAASAG